MFKENKIIELQHEVDKLQDKNFHLEQDLEQANRVNKALKSHNDTLQNAISRMCIESESPKKEFYTFDGEQRVSVWLSNGQNVQINVTAENLNELINEVLTSKIKAYSSVLRYKKSNRYLVTDTDVIIWSNDIVSISVDAGMSEGRCLDE